MGKADKINKIEADGGIDENGLFIRITMEKKRRRLILKKIFIKRIKSDKGKIREKIVYEEEFSEFPTRIERMNDGNEKTAVLDYTYTRGKERIGGRVKYTGNKKVGYCYKHGQIDADLNAARVIALCKCFNINEPRIFGEKRKIYNN